MRVSVDIMGVLRSGIGAGTKIRTRDLLITNQLLYQLSYAGTCACGMRILDQAAAPMKMELQISFLEGLRLQAPSRVVNRD